MHPLHLQALYPWRRVLREMFHHDAQLGQLYCLRGSGQVVTALAQRLQVAVPDFAQWRHLLADALDLPLSGGSAGGGGWVNSVRLVEWHRLPRRSYPPLCTYLCTCYPL